MNRGRSTRSAASAPRSRFVNASLAFIDEGRGSFFCEGTENKRRGLARIERTAKLNEPRNGRNYEKS